VPRTADPDHVAARRGMILDAAQELVLTRGYEQMSVQDILDRVGMSSGAFHHYFDSRRALLEALIDRIRTETEGPLLPIVHDPQLTALEKLRGFLETFGQLRTNARAVAAQLIHVWYTDDNAVVRLKVDEAELRQRTPLLAEIVRQGVEEGSFRAASPEGAGEVVLTLLHGMDNAAARLLLTLRDRSEARAAEELVASHSAYMEAVERVLGLAPHALPRLAAEEAVLWVQAVRRAGPDGASAPRRARPGRRPRGGGSPPPAEP
jgi:AcrR family transcriptional regulator